MVHLGIQNKSQDLLTVDLSNFPTVCLNIKCLQDSCGIGYNFLDMWIRGDVMCVIRHKMSYNDK